MVIENHVSACILWLCDPESYINYIIYTDKTDEQAIYTVTFLLLAKLVNSSIADAI